MDAPSYEKIVIEDPDFPFFILENDKDSHGNHQQLCPLHWHEHLELHYIQDGFLHIRINQSEYTLQKGDLVIINGNEPHCSYITGRLKERILIFQLTDLSKNLSEVISAFQQVIRQDAYITHIMAEFEQAYASNILGFDMLCKSYLLELIVYLARNFVDNFDSALEYQKHSRQLQRLLPVIEYIQLHYADKFSTEKLAGLLYLSKDRFNHLFKECMGIPLRKYINDIRLHTAHDWLEKGLCTPTEAASQVGFTDYNHFGRLFRQNFGYTPSEVQSKTIAK